MPGFRFSLADGKFAEAMREIESGRDRISEFYQQSAFPELEAKSSEIAFLEEWLEEVRARRPLSKLEVMEREMERAIAGERYERAAELRDAIRKIKTRPESKVDLAGDALHVQTLSSSSLIARTCRARLSRWQRLIPA